MTTRSRRDIERALRCARRYRDLGYNPLPSKRDDKRPDLDSFCEFWREPIPDSVFDEWRAPNIQLMCGAQPWRLMVVDCDGDGSERVWAAMRIHHGHIDEPTWKVETGGGGIHTYYRLPPRLDACPSRRLWGLWDTWAATDTAKPGSPPKGNWLRHREVRILGDGALVVAPPSIHVETGRRYRFLPGHGPNDVERPALAPDWLIEFPAAIPPQTETPMIAPPATAPRKAPGRPLGTFYRREEVLAAIKDKAAVARRWGLRIVARKENPNGWYACKAIDRPDDNPSASFHGRDGVYWESRDGVRLSLFDLAVALNAYETWQDARDALGHEFIGRRRGGGRLRRAFPPPGKAS
jgi:hypothetical protein